MKAVRFVVLSVLFWCLPHAVGVAAELSAGTARVEVGMGERMVDRGLIHIYRVLGRLKDKPEQP